MKYDIYCHYTVEADTKAEAEALAMNEERIPMSVDDIVAHDPLF